MVPQQSHTGVCNGTTVMGHIHSVGASSASPSVFSSALLCASPPRQNHRRDNRAQAAQASKLCPSPPPETRRKRLRELAAQAQRTRTVTHGWIAELNHRRCPTIADAYVKRHIVLP